MLQSPKVAVGFCAEAIPGGFTFTLTTVLGNILQEAERRYGPRDHSWTLLGIEFCGDDPHIWFPGNCKNISIMLTESARLDWRRAVFQLSHEVIHLLSPHGDRGAHTIEEGLATAFSHEIPSLFGSTYRSNMDSYSNAEMLVRNFLTLDPDGIRRLRTQEPSFREFTPELICRVCPSVPPNLGVALCQPFKR